MSVWPELTMNSCPVSALEGLPPSAGGLKRGSIQVPVHDGGSLGSWGVSKWESLYVVSVRRGVFDPSALASKRVFQNTSLPEKKARLTPWSRAASTLAR